MSASTQTESTTIVVTGLGAICPAGSTAAQSWRNLHQAGRFIRTLDHLGDDFDDRGWLGGVSEITASPHRDHMDRVSLLAISSAREALRQANLLSRGDADTVDPDRLFVSIGTSKGGIASFASVMDDYHGRRSLPSAQIPLLGEIPPDAPCRSVAQWLHACGGMHTSVGACATGLQAIIRGCRALLYDEVDVVICGGADASLHPLWLAAFQRMGVLAEPHPQLGSMYACRPYDHGRRGFSVGEGAGILILETLASAKWRAAQPLARIAGFAEGTDPTALTRMDESGRPLARVILEACRRAGCDPKAISAIMAHGTGTESNDRLEYRAFKQILGLRLSETPVLSIKGAIGHLLGAAGAVETVVAISSMLARQCPPNATLVESDPEFDGLNLPMSAVDLRPGPLLKTSLGFGGHLAALVLEPVEQPS